LTIVKRYSHLFGVTVYIPEADAKNMAMLDPSENKTL
jgi:hypothetical protein